MQAIRDHLLVDTPEHRRVPVADQDGAHAGLVLQRYLRDAYENSETFRTARTAVQRSAQAALDHALAVYRPAYARWAVTLPPPHVTGLFEVQGRLIVGLGGEHVLETGLTLHHTYGLPLIPGTALKGLAAHYCDQVWGRRDGGQRYRNADGGDYYHVLFGRTDEGGLIVFHDAWFDPDALTERTGLVPDVLTPHHGAYYSGQPVMPTDFDDPNPVAFLSVAGRFRVAVSARTPAEGAAWAKLAFDLLSEALSAWGVGGKTSSGYGRLKPVVAGAGTGARTKPTAPQHAVGKRVKVRRVADPKGKGRLWFVADDGFGGTLVSGDPPAVEIGQETELIVQAKLPQGYNFRSDG